MGIRGSRGVGRPRRRHDRIERTRRCADGRSGPGSCRLGSARSWAALDAALPLTSSFPSGHTAAAICRYGGVAAVVLRAVQVWWRWLVLGLAVLVIVAVAVGRLYRGAHYPTHVVGSVVFAVPWLLVTTKVCAPSGDQRVGPDQPVGSATSP